MDKYVVKLYARAYRDLDGIYTYIAENLLEPDTALNMADELESAIFSLEQLPERGAVRRAGAYANGNYRQLFVKNYTEKTAPKWGGELRKHFSKERCSQTAMPFFAVFELYFGLFLSPVQNQMHR